MFLRLLLIFLLISCVCVFACFCVRVKYVCVFFVYFHVFVSLCAISRCVFLCMCCCVSVWVGGVRDSFSGAGAATTSRTTQKVL